MDYIEQIKKLESSVDESIEKLVKIKDDLHNAASFTKKFLEECEQAGYTKISVGKKHKSVPETTTFPFTCSDSVFGFMPKNKEITNNWPPIWEIVSRMGVATGSGNSNQHQIKDSYKIFDGVYHLKSGKWRKVD